MSRKLLALVLVVGGLLLVAALMLVIDTPTVVDAQGDPIPDFVGSQVCADCHATEFEQQSRHGHNYKLNRVEDGQPPEYPYSEVPNPPEGYTWDDVSFVIGGYSWKARFIDLDGFIITGDENSTTQYNFPIIDQRTGDVIVEENWVPYHAGEERPYNCGSCHTTGYNHDPNTNMYDMPGMIGQWTEEGIQCEECHGPGSQHVEEPIRAEMLVDRSSEACGECHYRGAEGVVEATGGLFIKHHEQFEEIETAPHAALECVTCHNPHQSAVYADEEYNPNRSIRQACTNCHIDNTVDADHADNGVVCTDCHMAPMGASGSRSNDLLWGDVSTHLFQINTDITAPQLTEDGSAVMPYITLQYACTRCHVDMSLEDMQTAAVGFHGN